MSYHVESSVAGRCILRQETKDIRSWRNSHATASRAIGKMESSQLHGFQWIKSMSFVVLTSLRGWTGLKQQMVVATSIIFQPPPAMWFHQAALDLSTGKAIFSKHPTLTTSIKKCFFRAIGLGVRPIGMQRPMAGENKNEVRSFRRNYLLSDSPQLHHQKKDLKNIHFQCR